MAAYTSKIYYASGTDDNNALAATPSISIEQPTLPLDQFRRAMQRFFLTFSLGGVSVYKERIRKLGLHLSGTSESIVGSASMQLDLEHLNMCDAWQPTATPAERDTVVDDGVVPSVGDVKQTNWGEALMMSLRKLPLKFIPVAEDTIKEVYVLLVCRGSGAPQATKETLANVQMEVISNRQPIQIRALSAEDVESLVMIPGLVVQASKPMLKAITVKARCRDCGYVRTLHVPLWKQAIDLPRVCEAVRGADDVRCSLDSYQILSDESTFIDMQMVKVQEMPEDVPVGDMPRQLQLNCAGTLCSRAVPGQRLSIVGVYTAYDKQAVKPGAASVRSSYVHVLGIQSIGGVDGAALRLTDPSGSRSRWTYAEEEDFRQMANDPRIYENLWKSVAPAIFGANDIKKSVACMLFGGARNKLPDGTSLRGDINILLLGDPSTAKSQFLKFVEKVAPIGVYTSGKGSSAAGLTAAIVRDAQGNFALEGGAMILADGGVVCIDEFDKMRDDDRVAIHEAMEQQTISIAKAGITTILNTKCSVLAAANPTFGSYDDTKDTTEQHDFETTILSRFDLIWLVRDEKDIEKDKTIASHVFHLYSGAAAGQGTTEGPIDINKFRAYLAYCRSVCTPLLSETASKRLENFYVSVREDVRNDTRRSRDMIPITVRQLESLARIAESLAKMTLSRQVTAAHVEEAITLFKKATVEAAKSSIAREALTALELEATKIAENAILQRLPIGARASKQTIIRDLKQRGLETTIVGRALRVLIGRRVLLERGDASVYRNTV